MSRTPIHLDYTSVDRIVAALGTNTDITDNANAAYHIAQHDFARHSHLELRILGRFGFGGKLIIEHRGHWRAYPTAYPEDEHGTRFPECEFDRTRQALTELAPALAAEPANTCTVGHQQTIHIAHGPHTAGEQPTTCGLTILQPQPATIEPPTCLSCRIGRTVGPKQWRWLHELDRLLATLATRKTFPSSRTGILAEQRTVVADILRDPRQGAHTAIVRGHRLQLRPPGYAHPIRVQPDYRTSLPELVAAAVDWNLSVLRAHGAEHASRFPMRDNTLAVIERGLAARTATR